jgi:CheY-like chemotaxis protein
MVVRMVMKRQLEKSGYLVDLAESGEAAVAAVTRKSYAAILMDCQLPGMSGYQAAVEIRNIEGAARHTPIIAFTGSDKSNERQRCLEAGMDDYLVKPATVRAILAALADWGARP